MLEYGSGKSKIICDEFGEREEAGDLQDLCVVSGAGSYLNWVRDKSEQQPSEFHRHLSDDLNERLVAVPWVTGAGVGHTKELERMVRITDPRRPRALLMNIEALSTSPKARALFKAFMSAPGRRKMLVDDESTNIKSRDSERTKFMVLEGAEAHARRILSGLLVPNSPMDLYSQFEFLDWRILGHQSFYSFQARYAVLKNISVAIPGKTNRDGSQRTRQVKVEVSYRNEPELYDKIAPYSYRVLKADCLDLPPKTYAPIMDVEPTDQQGRMYKELREFATTQLDNSEWVTATMVIKRNLRIQQLLCGYTVDDNGAETDVPSNRGRALLELLGEHSGKAIIWCPFHNPLRKIVAALTREYGEGSVAQFHGQNLATRGEDERRWLGDPRCRWMVSTPAAGGKGNTWLPGTLEVFFANTFNLEDRLNAEDRPHRDGQTQPVTIQDLCSLGTNEYQIIQALRDKIDIASMVMGDGYKQWLI